MAIVSTSKFKQQVAFENPRKDLDAAGGRREIFVGFMTARGWLKKRGGFRALQETSRDVLVQEYDFFCYWRKELEDGLTKDTHVVYDNRQFQIIDYQRVDEQRMFYQFKLIAAE